MQMDALLQRVRSFDWKKHQERLGQHFKKKPMLIAVLVIGPLLILNLVGPKKEESRIIERGAAVSFQNGRILNDRESTFYYGQEKLLSRKAQLMLEGQTKLESRLEELEKKLQEAGQKQLILNSSPGPETQVRLFEAPGYAEGSTVLPEARRLRPIPAAIKGPELIAFPVKTDAKSDGAVLPAGSYVKAKILTGVDVPEGKTYPVLMVLDFSYVAPNDHKIDLSGCFMIAKAEGDLSTERVQMQATKMSCVSKKGKMFERDVNGFIADEKDGSFAMKGQVNSKQGRVAAMAFLAGVVDGLGKAVQAAQTTQSTNPLGGGSSTVSGDTGKYVAAGAASNAAGMVAQWYLQQAQSLAPTVAVGSGREVWIVMKDKVNLPEEFFKKERGSADEGISYFTRILE